MPLNAGQRPTILDIDDSRMPFEFGPDHGDGPFDESGVARRKLDQDGLANWRPRIRFAGLDRDAGKIGGPLTNFGENLVGTATLVPLDEIEGH